MKKYREQTLQLQIFDPPIDLSRKYSARLLSRHTFKSIFIFVRISTKYEGMEVSLISPKLISRFERYSKRVRQGTVNNNLNISIFGIALQVKARDAAKFFLDKSDM